VAGTLTVQRLIRVLIGTLLLGVSGALAAAQWVHGRRGWFTMKDVLGIG